jgi:hypothetical protein
VINGLPVDQAALPATPAVPDSVQRKATVSAGVLAMVACGLGDPVAYLAEKFADRQRKLVARPQWLIDGNYASTLPIRLAAADSVIFLDLPAITCLLGIFQRRWRWRGGQYINDGVFDRITVSFVRYIWVTGAPCGPRSNASSRNTAATPALSP